MTSRRLGRVPVLPGAARVAAFHAAGAKPKPGAVTADTPDASVLT